MRYGEKRTIKLGKMTQFTPNYLKFKAFRMLHNPKRHVALKVFTENKMFYISKRALRAGTTHNKWLKYALPYVCFFSLIFLLWFMILPFCRYLLQLIFW